MSTTLQHSLLAQQPNKFPLFPSSAILGLHDTKSNNKSIRVVEKYNKTFFSSGFAFIYKRKHPNHRAALETTLLLNIRNVSRKFVVNDLPRYGSVVLVIILLEGHRVKLSANFRLSALEKIIGKKSEYYSETKR